MFESDSSCELEEKKETRTTKKRRHTKKEDDGKLLTKACKHEKQEGAEIYDFKEEIKVRSMSGFW